MATNDKTVTIVPYFRVQDGKLDQFKGFCEQFVAKANTEPKCLYYGFSFDGNLAFCREGYEDAEALLFHCQNVGAILEEALKICAIERLEIHGPEAELAKLKEPLSALNPQYFTLEYGFRR